MLKGSKTVIRLIRPWHTRGWANSWEGLTTLRERGSWYCDLNLSKRSPEPFTKGPMGRTAELEARPNIATRWSPNFALQKIPQYSSPQTNLSPNIQLPSLQRASTTTVRAPIASPRIKPQDQRWGSPFKRLTDAQIQDKHDKDLCYRCNEKYFMGHRCKNKQLQILLVEEENGDQVT